MIKPGLQTFNTAYPFDISLENQLQGEGLSVIYIVNNADPDAASQQVLISISQVDQKKYTLKGAGFTPPTSPTTPAPANTATLAPSNLTGLVLSEENYNFSIAVRPGTLRENVQNEFTTLLYSALKSASPSNPCAVNGPFPRDTDGALVWYCAFKNDVTIAPPSADTAWNLSFTLNGISAAPGAGSRSTQIEFQFGNLLLNGTGDPISAKRSKHVDIINHLGHSYAPLYFGVLGKNVLLNKKAYPNELNISFETIDKLPVQFGPLTQIDFDFSYGDVTSKLMHFGAASEVNGVNLNENISLELYQNPNEKHYFPDGSLTTQPPTSGSGYVRFPLKFNPHTNPSDPYDNPTEFLENLDEGFGGMPGAYAIVANNYYKTSFVDTNKASFQKDSIKPNNWSDFFRENASAIKQLNLGDKDWPSYTLFWKKSYSMKNFKTVDGSPSIQKEVPSGFGDGTGCFQGVNGALFFDYFLENYDTFLAELNSSLSELQVPSLSYIIPCKVAYDYMYLKYKTHIIDTYYGTNEYITANHLVFKFSNIQISGDDGVVMLNITVRNLPGYWDTNFQVPIYKETSTLNGELSLGLAIDQSGHLGTGSRIDFLSGGETNSPANISIEENFGLNLFGTPEQFVKVKNTDLHVDEGRIKDKTGEVMPVGSLIAFSGKEPPTGWLKAEGQSITQAKYPDLYEVVGKKVPDMTADNTANYFFIIKC